MNELSQAAAVTSRIEIAGQSYTLSPLSIGDLAEFAQWSEDEAIARVDKRIAVLQRHGEISTEKKQEMHQRVFDDSDSGMLEAKTMVTMPGMRKLAWLSLRRTHPDLTEETVGALSLMDIKAVQQRIEKLSGLEPDPNDQSPAAGAGQQHGETFSAS